MKNKLALIVLVGVAVALQLAVLSKRESTPTAPQTSAAREPAAAAPPPMAPAPGAAPADGRPTPPGFTTPNTPALAPPFSLTLATGGEVTLDAMRARGPVLLVFFKTDCGTSQIALPRYEAFQKGYARAARPLQVIGIAQNGPVEVEAFARSASLTFPIALDTPSCEVSRQYGILNTPTLVLVGTDGKTITTMPSWSRSRANQLSKQIAELTGATYTEISSASDGMPDLRPG